MHTFDTKRDLELQTSAPLEPLFASVEKLEEERKAMVDTQNPLNTVSEAAATEPKGIPAILDISTPMVPVVDDRPKPQPISALNEQRPATPEGDLAALTAAANAAVVPKGQVAPVVMEGASLRTAGETVTMVFPHRVLLTIDHATQIEFKAGIQEVPVHLSTHPYLISNRVELYKVPAPPAAAFPQTVAAKETPFCPNCGHATALHIPPLKACPVVQPVAVAESPAPAPADAAAPPLTPAAKAAARAAAARS
jgi:hypothetical protein